MAKNVTLIYSYKQTNEVYNCVMSEKNFGKVVDFLKRNNLTDSVHLDYKQVSQDLINWNAKDIHDKFFNKITQTSFIDFLNNLNNE